MTKSIIQTGEPRCFYCGSRVGLERHHVLGGPNRKWSEKYGLWVYCCNRHHTDTKEGVQYNRQMNQSLKRLAQIAFEARHSRDEWMEAFRKNYL
jgi:hypothetical protein